MSKSDKDIKSRIELMDSPDVIREKLKKAVTDSTSTISYEPETRPGVSNLIDIHCACTDKFPEEIVEDCLLQVLDTANYKKVVADALIQTLNPIRKEYEKIVHDKAYLNQVIDKSTAKANEIASKNFNEISNIIGFNF